MSLLEIASGSARPGMTPEITDRISCVNLAGSHSSLRIFLAHSLSPVPAFLLIDPVPDMERTILKLDSARFAVSEKCYRILVDERHVPQIEYQRLPRSLDD